MKCPECGGKTTVSDSSFNPKTNEYSRRRKCLVCDHRFYTMEFEVERNKRFEKDWNKNHRSTKYKRRKKYEKERNWV